MKVFVYGTLKSGESNNPIMQGCGADFITKVRTLEPRKLVVQGLPYLNPPEIEGGVHVEGEIWEVPESMIWRLDQLEGHPRWYRREEDWFCDDNGTKWIAWVYYVTSERTGEAQVSFAGSSAYGRP